ncbi:MAG: hypothetical protein JW850_03110 [Thermoflexales bacterium]|nr:hypothetical protein [Thermoflexales bacterium]
MSKQWTIAFSVLAGMVLTLTLLVSITPASAQSAISSNQQATPGVLDYLATQSAYSSLATRQAIDQAGQAAEAQRQAAQAQARAAQAAAQSTIQAVQVQKHASELRATSEAAILLATIETAQTRTALEVKQTSSAMDEIERQRAATATTQALDSGATATAVAASAQAAATRQAEEEANRATIQTALYATGVVLISLVIVIAAYAGRQIAGVLKEWAHFLRPPQLRTVQPGANGGAGDSIEREPSPDTIIDVSPGTSKTQAFATPLPPVIVVTHPQARDAIESVLRKVPPERASDPDYFD